MTLLRKAFSLGGAALLAWSSAAAQPEEGPQARLPLYYEAVTFMTGQPGRIRVDVHYRIDADFFVAVRNSDPSFPREYRRRGDVSIELRDSTDMVRGRSIQQVDMGDNLSERPEAEKRWYQGIVRLEVAPGRYQVYLEATDRESRRNVLEKRLTVEARIPRPGAPEATAPFWILDSVAAQMPAAVRVLNFGGDVLFSSPTTLLMQVPFGGAPPSAISADYTFTRGPKGPTSDDLSGSVQGIRVFRNLTLSPRSSADSAWYDAAQDTSGNTLTLALPLPTERLRLRTFDLTVKVRLDTHTVSLRRPAAVIWPDMPSSLKNVDYALLALRYITTEHVLDSLRDGDFETRVRNLEGFWSAYDKTPATPHNEAMTEYYRRVDHAMKAFATLRRPDGFQSDRGKIYVLYGPPTNTERDLDPASGFREIWKYERLNKTFVFVDRARSGDYVLLQPSQ